MERRFVLGDIHGNYRALKQILVKSKFDYEKDKLIIIGDVVDGYSCSFEVVEELLKIKKRVFILGNHDVWWMNHMATGWAEDIWLMQGGKATRESYKSHNYHYKKLPQEHKDFFNSGIFWYEIDDMLFVHGGFDYPKHPRDCTSEDLIWDRELIERMKNGLRIKEWKKIFVGHTTTENADSEPSIIDYHGDKFAKLIKIDCGAGWSGRLCLYNIDTDEYFLSNFAKKLNPNEEGR